MTTHRSRADRLAVSPYVLQLREFLQSRPKPVAQMAFGTQRVDLLAGADALWAVVRGTGEGGIALRVACAPGIAAATVRTLRDDHVVIVVESPIGRQVATIRCIAGEIPVLRGTVVLTPAVDLLLPYTPRDLYPLGRGDDPADAVGKVEAAQRGLNSGLCYLRLEEPAVGSVLYFQNYTALNDRFRATGTLPDGAVGGEWPELGYLPPSPPQAPVPPVDPLPRGKDVTVWDGLLAIHADASADERDMAKRYLMLLAAVYRQLDAAEPDFHDWVERAERTLHDLDEAPEATIEHYGHRYIHPYTASEYPDAMVQLSVTAALRDYEAWTGEAVPLRAAFAAGLRKFYDRRLGTMRRYLPNVGKDKDKDAVDSWYLYHPLMNLGRLAIDGDRRAERLFRQSIDFGIRAAKHFEYRWPIQYKITDFSVIQEARNDDGLGQTDVGGIYAYVMLQAFELTDEKRFLDEARAALSALRGMRFKLNYQANLTAWGAAACLRLWRIDDEPDWLAQAHVFLASFFHNCAIWESRIGHAEHYPTFLGVCALHDAPYMAMYECFDSFAAFERCLKDGGPDLDAGVRMLLSEYCRHALDRAWYYYPDALPADAVSPKQREPNGWVDRKLSFPVEDLYVDGQPAGQVGQEIYGSGAAFVFASRTFHRFENAPFRLFCDHFLTAVDSPSDRTLTMQLAGGEGRTARLILLRDGRRALPKPTLRTADGNAITADATGSDRIAFRVPADGRVAISW